jgi:hypothetical protein
MAVVIRGERCWRWRAVDNEGEGLDFLVQRNRDAREVDQRSFSSGTRYGCRTVLNAAGKAPQTAKVGIGYLRIAVRRH